MSNSPRHSGGGAPFRPDWLHDPATGASPAGPPADSGGYLRIAHRVGIPILAGTDTDWHWVDRLAVGFSLHVELAIFVAEGLTPLEALQSATLNPAKLLHGTDSLGTVAPGKLADLVLLDANPLADITHTTAIRAVVANGRYFDRAALDQLLADGRCGRWRSDSFTPGDTVPQACRAP